DEVHMLTREAFNTLLKTMEEPPGHVKFILCTTEPNAVPPTIQSRCQRFDFRNIPTGRIAEHLTEVLEKEGVKADADAVHRVARMGRGSMRDALSVLDRLIATGESHLTDAILEQMLGLPEGEIIDRLIAALGAGDTAASLGTTAELLERGVDQQQLLETLAERLRELMLVSACGGETELLELGEEGRKQTVKLAGAFDTAGLVHMIALCESVRRASRGSGNPRALLDAVIVRLALAEKMADVTAILEGGDPAPAQKKK
ncbi:MAG: hypothetical protein R3336_02335, partial [Phycisphaeraceae bacterium]|nr:hypothetical protein [Phycisphaeraceae bacterium]